MRRGQPLLLPANPRFIWVSLLLALLLDLLPLGRLPWMPDFVVLVLAFWGVHQPRYVGLVGAFVLGLVLDVHQAALLGQHALAYTLLVYFATVLHRRLLWFRPTGQALQMLPFFALTYGVIWLVRLLEGASFPGWTGLLPPLIETALWPLACAVLLAPQRRAPHPDATRPL